MTVEELAKELAKHIAAGGGHHLVTVFQWQHGSEEVTETRVRDGFALELYTGTQAAEPVTEPLDETSTKTEDWEDFL